MVKHVLVVLAFALALGFAASLGTGRGTSAEAASNPAIIADSGIDADTCTATQTGYYNYGGYGYGYGYGGYGYMYGGLNPYLYPPQPIINAPYGNYSVTVPCNYTQCMQVPFYTNIAVCPGPPAGITMPASPTNVTCASATDITVSVYDANGFKVADGTEVDFTTTFGMITAVTQTQDGAATATLNTPTKQTGTAVISARSGSASGGMTITVGCNAPGTTAGGAAPAQVVPAAPAPMSNPGYSYGYGGGY